MPLDFDHPLSEVWPGFVTPEALRPVACPAEEACCDGRTAAGAWLRAVVNLLVMADDDLDAQARGRSLHPWLDDIYGPFDRRSPFSASKPRPTAELGDLLDGLTGGSSRGVFGGRGSLAERDVAHALVTAAGLDPSSWGVCPVCHGASYVEAYPGQEAEEEAWKETPPPAGVGWQMWESVSEGSPVSPVFPTAEALALWMSTDYRGPLGSRPSLEAARRFVEAGWAPSAIGGPEVGLRDGVSAS